MFVLLKSNILMRPRSTIKEEAIRSIALQIIAAEGLENLSMQKLAKAAGISPRTIYLKYENKEDLLITLFVDDVLGAYEAAVLEGFSESMDFEQGMKKLWLNMFRYCKQHKESFVLMEYGKSSPLLHKAYQERHIQQGRFFAPVHRFLQRHAAEGTIRKFPHEVHRALLFAPVTDLVHEYFEYHGRSRQIITEKVVLASCETVIAGMLL